MTEPYPCSKKHRDNKGERNPMFGKHHTDETKQKLRLANLGQIGYWTGKERSEETKEKLRLVHKGISTNQNEKNGMWKGDNVGYGSLHDWVKRHFPAPEVCDNCRETKKLDLSCVTGKYNRNFSNWKYLCRKCHMESDGRMKNLKQHRVTNN